MAYTVELTEYAESFLAEQVSSSRILDKIEQIVKVLAEYPAFGRAYDPEYPAATPPFPCRSIAVADTPFTLYYTVDEERQVIIIVSVEWSAGNPAQRFSWLY